MDRLPGHGLYVVLGEISILYTAMRKGFKWSSHAYQEEEQDHLMQRFQELKNILNHRKTLASLDLDIVLNPFLEVIRSEDTSGTVTEIALSAVFKFISYGFLDPQDQVTSAAVQNIADAVTHARFVGTDPSSDEVVLMKILQVLRALLLSPAGSLLTNENVCEIMQSCFRICFESRLSELLRKSAEHALCDMVRWLFLHLPNLPEETKGVNYRKLKMRTGAFETSKTKKKASRPRPPKGSQSEESVVIQASAKFIPAVTPEVEPTSDAQKPAEGQEEVAAHIPAVTVDVYQTPPQPVGVDGAETRDNQEELENPLDRSFFVSSAEQESESYEKADLTSSLKSEEDRSPEENCDAKSVDSIAFSSDPETLSMTSSANQDYINPRGVRFLPSPATIEESGIVLVPYSLPCVKELLRFLISLINPRDRQNTEVMNQIGLRLLTIAVETAGDYLPNVPSLLSLIQDETCKYLFALLAAERLSIYTSAIRLCFLLFEAMRTQLKFQLEGFFTRLVEIAASESNKIPYERKEIALDCIVQLWRIPGLLTELYLNYDCELYTSDLFEDLVKILSKNAFPVVGVYSTHLLSVDALLTVLESIEAHCQSRVLSRKEDSSSIDSEDSVEKRNGSNTVTNSVNESHGPREKVRAKTSEHIPSHEQLMALKHKKKLLLSGAEQFNVKPSKGIQYLQENGLLSTPLDPKEVAHFLRENPRLDKKMIGEYVSNRNNKEVLEAFVKSFDFRGKRIDEALRLYLEAFRLPGEAPVISVLMEHFAEHWHVSVGEPFVNADSAFTLAYAVIMLNVDQHNHNVKKQNIPMTVEEFKKNLSKVNGGQDFDHEMLETIYSSIKNEEIVMPAEQTGLVKENYLWKVLLRRGATKDGHYIHAPNGLYDHDLFSLLWGPAVAALSYLFDKSMDEKVVQKAVGGFKKCATIASHYGMVDAFENLILTFGKFTTLLNSNETPSQQAVSFGYNLKAHYATRTLFGFVLRHGDILRESWKHIVECIIQFCRLRILPAALTEAEDFLHPSGKIALLREEVLSRRTETSLFSSLYSYLSDSSANKAPSPEDQEALAKAKTCVERCNLEQLISDSKFLHIASLECFIKALINADLGPESHLTGRDDMTVFILEFLIQIVIQNRDRVTSIWTLVRDHVYSVVMEAAAAENAYLLERSVVGLLRLGIRLMRRDDLAPLVLQSLRMLLLLKPAGLCRVSRSVAYGLHELLKTSAANIHSASDWSILFTLLECAGAGARPPKVVGISDQAFIRDNDLPSPDVNNISERGYTSDSELYTLENRTKLAVPATTPTTSSPDLSVPPSVTSGGGGWILVGKEGEIEQLKGQQNPGNQYRLIYDREFMQHDPLACVKACESLSFLIRDVAHITPENFENAIHCIRVFVEASMHGGKVNESKVGALERKKGGNYKEDSAAMKRSRSSPLNLSEVDENDTDELPSAYHQVSIQLLDLMHTLHTRAAQIYRWWASEGASSDSDSNILSVPSLWSKGWCPLLQGIARLCCDSRRQVRATAVTYLQRALLMHDLQVLTAIEWESCFNTVLFPLLARLLEPQSTPKDSQHWEETRMRAATLLSKVFLQHLNPLLELPTFTALWLTILDFMDKYMHADHSDLLFEAIPEMLKNILLVMHTAGVLGDNGENNSQSPLWNITWDRIDTFLPGLKADLFKAPSPKQTMEPTNEQILSGQGIDILTAPENEKSESENATHSPAIPVTSSTIFAASGDISLTDPNTFYDSIASGSSSPQNSSLANYFQPSSPIRTLFERGSNPSSPIATVAQQALSVSDGPPASSSVSSDSNWENVPAAQEGLTAPPEESGLADLASNVPIPFLIPIPVTENASDANFVKVKPFFPAAVFSPLQSPFDEVGNLDQWPKVVDSRGGNVVSGQAPEAPDLHHFISTDVNPVVSLPAPNVSTPPVPLLLSHSLMETSLPALPIIAPMFSSQEEDANESPVIVE